MGRRLNGHGHAVEQLAGCGSLTDGHTSLSAQEVSSEP